jgi:small subunit ribosomal protein S9
MNTAANETPGTTVTPVTPTPEPEAPTFPLADPPPYYTATGRRKCAVARVRLKPNGSGLITCNKKRTLDQYFEREGDRLTVLSPLVLCAAEKKFDVFLTLSGGGTAGQAGACKMGISRALSKASVDWLGKLKIGGYLTRDAREKERRKYGRRGARASYQFSKR